VVKLAGISAKKVSSSSLNQLLVTLSPLISFLFLIFKNKKEIRGDSVTSSSTCSCGALFFFRRETDYSFLKNASRDIALMLSDRFESSAVRWEAVPLLGRLQPAALAEHAAAIVPLVEDAHFEVRAAALLTLHNLPAALEQHVGVVVPLLADAISHVRRAALETLGQLEPEALAQHAAAVVPLLEDAHPNVRIAALQTLRRLPAAALAEHAGAIVALLEDADLLDVVDVPECVAELLKKGAVEPATGSNALFLCLCRNYDQSRARACARRLIEYGVPLFTPELRDVLERPLDAFHNPLLARTLQRLVNERCPPCWASYVKLSHEWPAEFRKQLPRVRALHGLLHNAERRPGLPFEVIQGLVVNWVLPVTAEAFLEEWLWWRGQE
jgi:hypothetical protein